MGTRDILLRPIRKWWWNRKHKTRQLLTFLGLTAYAGLGMVWVVWAVAEWGADDPNTLTLNWLALALIFQVGVVSFYFSFGDEHSRFKKKLGELWTEFAGAFLFSALLLVLVTIPDQRREINELKQRLIREMRSPDNSTALLAVDELRERNWLSDGTLQGADLARANLQGAALWGANLQHANLWGANLQDAVLEGVNLQGAALWGANLQHANLWGANLQGTDLENASLQGAILMGVNLQGADLRRVNLQGMELRGVNLQGAALAGANLQGADLWDANLQGTILVGANLQGALLDISTFDDSTTFPDNTTWTPETNIFRFTDPNHPDFWRSDDPHSPAYRGGDDAGGE